MKANDSIPRDEMLLAEAIAAAKARGLKWTSGAPFLDEHRNVVSPARATVCCAVGGLVLAGRATIKSGTGRAAQRNLAAVHLGNDFDLWWEENTADHGESLGWAFRCAMESDNG